MKEHVFTLLKNKNKDSEVFTFLINYDLMCLFTKEELDSLQIKKIVLDYPFNNKIQSEIGFLKSLEELSIYSENIVIELHDTIGNLNSLKKLHLLGCEKVEKIPQTIIQLKSLKSLSLPYYISYIPDWIETLINLEELELSVYNIKKLPRFIKNLKNLKILKIYSSQNLENKDLLKELLNLEKLDAFLLMVYIFIECQFSNLF